MVMNYIKNQVQMIHSHGKSTYLNNNYLKKKNLSTKTQACTHIDTHTHAQN